MGWATEYIARLLRGEMIQCRPRRDSMRGRIESGQPYSVEPVDPAHLTVGDIVLCKVNGHQYLHLIKAVPGTRLLIGNNRDRINSWIGANCIYGKCVRIE